ncbi:MAG: GNAT family N-acetyltransferase [Vulcanimicrobiaceae bacterium]
MDSHHITLDAVMEPTNDARALVDELEAALAAEYTPEQRHGFAIEALFEPNVRFTIARRGGFAVGCCGVAFFDEYAELKRMFVREVARGSGVADALLAHVELVVAARGVLLLRLETGVRQTAALRFYERSGFVRTEKFGAYRTMCPAAIATSVFMEKRVISPP